MMRCLAVPVIASSVLLGACAGASGWSRGDAGPGEIRAALRVCEAQARDATARERTIEEDIDAARPSVAGDPSGLRAQMRGAGTRVRYDRIVDRCMRDQRFVRPRLQSDWIPAWLTRRR